MKKTKRIRKSTEPIYLLSVDWDFFPRVKSDEWDWQHAESMIYREMLWPTRAAGLILSGVEDYRAMTAPKVKIAEVLAALEERGLSTKGASITVSDSHCRGMPAFAPFLKTHSDVRIVHFDAHHDLGYHAETVRDHEKRGIVACDDWLYFLMAGSPGAKLDIVYPAWRGDEEFESFANGHEGEGGVQPWYAEADLGIRTGVYVWPELPEDFEPGRVAAIHFCRSGSWAPPWHDEEYIASVNELAKAAGTKPHARWESEEKCNVLTPRNFSTAEVEFHVDSMRALNARNEAMLAERRAKAKEGGP